MADDTAVDCLFERLRLYQPRSPEAAELARGVASRINTRLTSHDKLIRQNTLDKLWCKQTGAVQILLSILENSRDNITSSYITSILRDVLCLKQGKGKKCSANNLARQQCCQHFISLNGTQVMLRALLTTHSKRDGNVNTELMQQDIVWTLAALAPKDGKFANKVRMLGCVRTMHLILKGHLTDNKIIFPLLVIMKQLSKNALTTSILVRDGVVATYDRLLSSMGFIPTTRLRLCLDTIDYLSKNIQIIRERISNYNSVNKMLAIILHPLTSLISMHSKAPTSLVFCYGVLKDPQNLKKYDNNTIPLSKRPNVDETLERSTNDTFVTDTEVCCMQIVKAGLCSVLLRVFDKWDRYEGRMRLKIYAHTLQTLKHVCNIKSGRRALCTKKNVQTLHRFCSQCPDEPEFDGLLARVCSVITLCLRYQALPVPASSPAVFNLEPITKGTNTSWPCLDDDDDGANSDTKTVNSDVDDEGQDTDDFFSSNASFEESDSKTDEICKSEKSTRESIQSALWINSNERDLEDLKKYFIFFKEFGSYSRQLKFVKGRSNSKGSILEDFLASQSSSRRDSPSLSYASGTGNVEFESAMLLNMPSFLTGYNKIQESSSSLYSSLKIHKDIPRHSTFEAVYTIIASRVKSITPFVKVAYPDMTGGQGLNIPEPLNKMDRAAYRNKLLSSVDKAINPDAYINDVVYDLDVLCSGTQMDSTFKKSFNTESNRLNNYDEQELLKVNTFCPRLGFESRFESGNLRKAIQVGQREYDLILMPDVNSNKRHQWFYFEVRNMQPGRPYVFNIINCEKSDSQFNFGMKPLLYSVKEAVLGRPGWIRTGSDICYYRNSYHCANQKSCSKCYLTVTFTIDFPHANDVGYLAYHFPYTYSLMMTRLWQWCSQLPSGVYFRVEPLCYSLNGNEVPVITLTAEDTPTNPIVDREIVFLTSRVHPGESNASWVMDGTLGRALADTPAARALRSKYIFKIVPMLNVEGVINGCHRCGLTNEDLNRRWCKPSPVLHPTIYHTKGLIEYLVRVWRRPPLVYCDYHGHSRKKNVFFYGCAASESWCSTDRLQHDDPVKYLILPALMHRISPAFALGSCAFHVGRDRESTARVAVWRHLNVPASYTMEASFCGFDRGPYKGFHLSTRHLQEVGGDFCEALSCLADSSASVDVQLTRDLHGKIEVDSEGSATDSVLKTDSDEDFD